MSTHSLLSFVSITLLLPSLPVSAVSFDWAHVGDPGNACDVQSQGCFGSVAVEFSITTTEVTNAQYAEFLNAVAADDPNGLYSTSMDTAATGGITRRGTAGSYVYATKLGAGKLPVTHVSFWDAVRFANWLHNGQPTGAQGAATTEDGAYTLTAQGIADNTVLRNLGWHIAVPSEDEWYKAAYYDAVSASYYDYAAGSDVQTICAAPGATANTANCGGVHGSLTDVGSYTGSPSPSGTFDQGGNVWEWSESITGAQNRVLRGGSSGDNSSPDPLGQHNLSALRRFYDEPADESFEPLGVTGFRVVSLPEPGTTMGLILGLVALVGCSRRARGVGVAVGLACILVAGGPASAQVTCPFGGDATTAAEILPELLPDEDTLASWQRTMVDLGPRFTGSPAHKAWHDFMAAQLAANGYSVARDPIPIEWWDHQTWSLQIIEGAVVTDIPVASYYPYSGSTPPGGIVADLEDAGMGLPEDFAAGDFDGKIAFYEEDMLPANASIFFGDSTYVHDPDATMTPVTDYKRASLSFLTPQELTSVDSAASAGAVGGLVSYEASPENAAGQYTPFLTSPGGSQGVPTLYVDRATGDMIKAKIAQGASARLELVVDKHPNDVTDYVIGTLPGTNPDEVIIFNTHTDGTSASQENGTIGIMALAQYFGSLPIECRNRTIVVAMTPGHFHSGIGADTDGFIANYPEIIAKAVGSVTLEHLGQTEWLDDAVGFHPSGYYEPAAFFGSASGIQAMMTQAVIAEDLRRTFVMRPYGIIYFGVGSPLNAAGVPNAAYITGPNMMLSFADDQHIDKLDYRRMAAEIRTATRVAAAIDAAPTDDLCAGMRPTPPGEDTGCTEPDPAP